LLEEIRPVADGKRARVRAQTDDRAVRARCRFPLPREERALEVVGAEIAEVGELVRLGLSHLGDTGHLDPLDV
jgi:hypothetical protein